MKQTRTLAIMVLSGFLALLISGNAAANWSWSLGSFAKTDELNRSGTGAGAPDVKVWGFSNSNEAWYINADRNQNPVYGTGKLVRRDIQGWSGAGVDSPASSDADYDGERNDGMSPYHGVDNMYHIDSILLDFGTTFVTLSQVALSYIGQDSDFMLTAYRGNDGEDNEADLTKLEYSDLTDSGWETVGDYNDTPAGGTANVNSGEVSSSLWLITALNPWKNNEPLYQNHFFDAFKVGSVSGKPVTTIPEPAITLLLGSALLMVGIRRKYIQNREVCAIKA